MTQHDLVVRNGLVIDGTGAPARAADVAIDGSLLTEIGPGLRGKREIDATGCIVTPGFVDIHCHYDGQASWDEEMLPSSVHGVTTAVIGNCGVGFAPVRPSDRDRLVRLMEGVEDIPGAALAEGLNWRWESFGEYLEALDRMPRTMDLGLLVPHDPLRLYVMGDRAERVEPSTEADVEAMRALLRTSLDAGALGFSTGRSDNHRTADGKATPASEAGARELEGLGRAFQGRGRGVLSAVSDFDMNDGPEHFDREFDVLEAMAKAAGRPLSISTLQRDVEPEQYKRILARIERANANGIAMRAQVAPRGIGVILGLPATFHPFLGYPSYKAISHLPVAERARRMKDPELRAKILAETPDKLAGDGSAIPPLADKLIEAIDFVAMRLFRLGDPPNYEPERKDCLFAEAMQKGIPPLAVVYDALVEEDGEQLLYFPIFNYMGSDLSVVEEMLHRPDALVALSDGGAHVGTICDASFPTYLLTHWTRDRARGRLSIEQAIHKLTGANAGYFGLEDRGVLKPGKKADVNVIDHAALRLDKPQLVADLPAGGRRFLQAARGYRATILSGQVTLEHDRLTGARPGRVARG
jgi:N-acyl-D-aspartate/D-glutamate deacylase